MAVIHTPQTPPTSTVETYVNPAFTTDSLEEEDSRSSCSPSPAPRRYTFTPRRVVKLPRAWERKPSTPFAPRNEGQRIWKRIPLGEAQANINMPKARDVKSDGRKAVKRSRADGASDENATYVNTKWDEVEEVARRKVAASSLGAASEFGFISDASNVAAESSVDVPVSSTEEQAEKNFLIEGRNETSQARTSEDVVSASSETSLQEADVKSGDASGRRPEEDTVDYAMDERGADDIELILDFESDNAVDATAEGEQDASSDTIVHSVSQSVASTTLDEHQQGEQGAATSARNETHQQKTQQSRRRSSLAALFTGHGLVCLPQPAEESVNAATDPSVNLTNPIAHDDTAYLHEFLTRARAQKAAKSQSSPDKAAAPHPAATSHEPIAPLDINPLSPTMDEGMIQYTIDAADDETDAKASSPCRRSTRTRLPRPQKLTSATPSSIPVRRSNGTEFIFLQRTEAQEIALATRANTKRNKGAALPPRFKLPHLNDPNVNTSPFKSPKKRKSRKEVTWREELTQFSVEAEKAEERCEVFVEMLELRAEDKPKARKMRKLGTVNGTPAPKRTMEDVGTPSQIPGRRLRSRVRS